MFTDLLHSSYFSLFLIVALGFMLGRIKIRGLSLDVSAVIFIALLFGHFGVIIPKELGNFGLVLFIFTIGIQASRAPVSDSAVFLYLLSAKITLATKDGGTCSFSAAAITTSL